MDLLLYILAIGVGFLFFQVSSLKKRLKTLESRDLERVLDTTDAVPSTSEKSAQNISDPTKSGPWDPPERKEKAKLKRLVASPSPTNEAAEAKAPRAFVFRADLLKSVTSWMAANWFYALAAISLALAGIFLIQYSVEAGLLSPPLRVLGALILGGALILTAEVIRRKGSDESGDLAFLPSVFAAGGFITLFGAFWGAFSLYGLIGPLMAFSLLAIVGVGAILCGWLYGPLVSAVGTLGAIATPFLLGGESDNTHLLMPYFATVSAGALLIDSLKRWAWLSVLAIAAGICATTLIYIATEARPTYLATMIGFVFLAVIIPIKSLFPTHAGPSLLPQLIKNTLGATPKLWPDFPPRLVLATLTAASAATLLVFSPQTSVFWLCLLTVGALLLLTLVWLKDAPGLEDASLIPAATLLAVAGLFSTEFNRSLWRIGQIGEETASNDITRPVIALGLVALIVSALAGWRSLKVTAFPVTWSVAAVTFAPLMAIILDVLWQPTSQLGRPLWAICLITVAALMTWLTLQYAQKDGENRLRMSIAMCSAIVMIAFAIVAILSETALTVALALTTVITAYLAVRQNLPLLGHLVSVGAIVVSARLVLNPGVLWAYDAPWWELIFVFVTSIGLLFAARRVYHSPDSSTAIILHSGIWSLGGIFTTILLFRVFEHFDITADYFEAGLIASVWLILAFTQLYRLQTGSWLTWVRRILGSLYLVVGTLLVGLTLTLLNPLFSGRAEGLPIVNTLLLTYGLPALILGLMCLRLTHLTTWIRRGFAGIAGLLGVFTIFVVIRHVWRRPDIRLPEMEPGELYTYTVVMMVFAGGLLLIALQRQSLVLRRAALTALGLTAAKVFLIDASGLTGLIRVFAFLALGLTLAGLAWLNRKFESAGVLTTDPDPDNQGSGENNDTENA